MWNGREINKPTIMLLSVWYWPIEYNAIRLALTYQARFYSVGIGLSRLSSKQARETLKPFSCIQSWFFIVLPVVLNAHTSHEILLHLHVFNYFSVNFPVEPDVDMPDATADPSVSLPPASIPGENNSDSIVTVVKKERKPNLTCKQLFTEVAKSGEGRTC